jgi:hypothetical protein
MGKYYGRKERRKNSTEKVKKRFYSEDVRNTVSTYQTTWCQNPGDHNMSLHHHQNLNF